MAETADMDDDNATPLKHGNEAFCELHAGDLFFAGRSAQHKSIHLVKTLEVSH